MDCFDGSREGNNYPFGQRSSPSLEDAGQGCSRRGSVIPSTVASTHQPQPLSRRIDHGAPVVVRTGKPWASASATTIPKLSEWVGSTNSSASKKADFFIPYARGPMKETTCPKPAAVTAFSTCFWWPASSGPAIRKIQPSTSRGRGAAGSAGDY